MPHGEQHVRDLRSCACFSPYGRREVAAQPARERYDGEAEDQEIATEYDRHQPNRNDAFQAESQERPAEQDFIGDGIQERANL